ncbi:MAG: hypothetical protein IT372_31885 [Polyangiaceae bacterium]|nr:hypothetical protein [Polyangiaceae bacterium]
MESPSRAAAGGGEDLRRAAGALILGIHRLVRACLLHADATQAVLPLVAATADAIVEVCALSGAEAAAIAPAGEVVLVNGHAVRAPREMPGAARELGALFEACGVREIQLDRGVRRADLAAFARILADAQRDQAAAARVAGAELRGIRVLRAAASAAGAERRSATARAARAYAAALLVAREIEAGPRDAGGGGEAALHRRALRAAQRLVSAAEEDPGLLVSLAAAKAADPDGAGAAAAAAVLALGMARQLTTDRRALAALVSAGLLCGAGRARLAGRAATRAPSEDERERLPASAVIAMTAVGKLHAPAVTRAAIAYEALAMQAGARQGAAQGGRRPPALLAQILAVARAFVEIRAAPIAGGPGSPAPGAPRSARPEAPSAHPGRGEATVDGVVQLLMDRADGAAARTLVKLLVAALGFFPSGTLVQLSTGELGIVTAVGELPARSARPRVRLLYDARGAQLGAPIDVDLAEPPPDGVLRVVARPIDADAPQARAIRAALAGAFASRPPQAAAPAALAPSSRRASGELRSPAEASGSARAGDRGYPRDPPPTTRRQDRVRTAPAPLEPGSGPPDAAPVAAAWLGRPLSPSGSHEIAPAPRPPPPRRPPPVDRAALLEKLRESDMASTQPPPLGLMAPPDVPRPPRLPRPPTRPEPAANIRSSEPRTSGRTPPHGQHAPPPHTVRSAGLRDMVSTRRIDPRTEPDVEETWTDSADTIGPPAPPAAAHAEHDAGEGWPDLDDLHLHDLYAPHDAHAEHDARATTPRAPEARGRAPTRRPDPRMEPVEDETWDDTAALGPPSDGALERDRLLAAYLAERTPAPVNMRELLANAGRHAAEPPPHAHRRTTRAPIPREEPEDPPEGSAPRGSGRTAPSGDPEPRVSNRPPPRSRP